LKYPTATGNLELRQALAAYFNTFYDAGIDEDHIDVFAGGRPGIFATLAFLQPDTTIAVEETEYTPYYDMLEGLGRSYELVESGEANRFEPSVDAYLDTDQPSLIMLSNPCNPTGVTRSGEDLKRLVEAASAAKTGVLFDEAYELFHSPPVSALQYVRDIDESDLFVV